MPLPASLPLTEEDWNNTLPTVQALLLTLWEEVSLLRQEMAFLRERVSKNSTNSSLPPSKDSPTVEKRKRQPSGRKPSGQPGHEGISRRLLSLEEVSQVIPVRPTTCEKCGHELCGNDPTPIRHQVTDVPPLVAETIEYQLHTLECPACGKRTRAPLPADVPGGDFGPRVRAMIAALSGQYHLSKRQIEELFADFFGLDLGSKICP